MSTPAPIDPTTTAAASGEPVEPMGFEYALHKFWEKNAKSVYAFSVLVLLVILGKGGYDYYQDWQNKKVGAEYAAASTSEKLKSFVTANPTHPLAGAARLRLADEAYVARNFKQAALDYQASADIFKTSPFAGRALLGAAIAKLQAGQQVEGLAQLNVLAKDESQLKAVRAEAAYQLASEAATAGRTDDAHKFLDQVSSISPAGAWAQRAMMLRSTLPAPVVSVLQPAAATPAVKLPAKP